jgi:hypothetical protein
MFRQLIAAQPQKWRKSSLAKATLERRCRRREAIRLQRIELPTPSMSARSIANARRIIGYELLGDSEVVYANQIRELMLEPARQTMVQGEARGGKGSR